MGHDVATHKKHFQYRISVEEKRKQIMATYLSQLTKLHNVND